MMNFDLKKFVESCKRTDPMIAQDVLSWKPEDRTKLPSEPFAQYIVLKRHENISSKGIDIK